MNAAVPLIVGETSVWTTPQLAYAIAITPDLVRRALLLGQVDHWLRRCLNEVVLAEKLEALVRPSQGPSPLDHDDASRVGSALLGMSLLLDPSAPLICHGICLMPDGIGTLLASLDDRPGPERERVLAAIHGALPFVASQGEDDEHPPALEARARQIRNALRTSLGRLHLTYELNPSARLPIEPRGREGRPRRWPSCCRRSKRKRRDGPRDRPRRCFVSTIMPSLSSRRDGGRAARRCRRT